MLAEWLQTDSGAHDGLAIAGEPAIVTPSASISWTKFLAKLKTTSAQFSDFAGQRVGLLMDSTPESLALLFGLLKAKAHLFLVAADTPSATVQEWAQDYGLRAAISSTGDFLSERHQGRPGSPDAITILTSGTTGKPKAVEHTWQSLIRPVRKTKPGAVWLLTFRPQLYAGLQVIMQCLLNYGTLVLPQPHSDATAIANLASQARVSFVSATPSFWRWFLALGGNSLNSVPLKQVTLGGEAADQATLDDLKTTFPNARIIHIYATTELGKCFSVSDGMAGFPASMLDSPSDDGIEMKIEDGELIVRSANAMAGYDGKETVSPNANWFHTGDLVAHAGNRIVFVGRKTDMINVGGNKVYPLEVETVILSVPGVADTRVYGETSSLVGELVKCDIVVGVGFDEKEVEQTVRKKALAELTNYQRPRFISIVDQIPRTDAGKTKRQ